MVFNETQRAHRRAQQKLEFLNRDLGTETELAESCLGQSRKAPNQVPRIITAMVTDLERVEDELMTANAHGYFKSRTEEV